MKHRKVSSVMTPADRVLSVAPDAGYKEIAEVLRGRRISAVPVLGDGSRVLGVVSDADLLAKESRLEGGPHVLVPGRGERRERAKAAGDTARELMTSPAVTIRPDEDVVRAARVMESRHVKRLVVTDGDGVLAGVVSRRDILGVFTRSDADIRRDIEQDVILGMLWMDPATVDVQVDEGVAHLRGRVETRSLAEIAGHVVRRTDGVVDVVNELEYERDDSGTKPPSAGPYGIFENRAHPD